MNSAKYVAGSTIFYPITSIYYWQIAGSATVNNAPVLSNLQLIIDTGTTLIVVPTTDATSFYSHIGGVPYANGYYQYPCANNFAAGLQFSGNSKTWNIPTSLFNLGKVSDTYCLGAIVAANIANEWIVGDRFISSTYSTFDYDRSAVGFSTLSS